ncbi:MAG: response regulator [Candidatus Eremiobacteraeota bacterium]|nr:response regulator [Candidatus Eremiobacteraeota bacterium]
MAKVILAGLSIRYRARLQGRLKELEFVAAASGKEALEVAANEEVGLLIIDETLTNPAAEEVLEELKSRRIPTLYCSNEGKKGDFLKNLVRKLGVSLVLYKPLDPEELVRHTALMMAVPIPKASMGEEGDMANALQKVWEKYQPVNLQRVTTIKDSLLTLQEGTLDPEMRRSAEREAHKLAGGLGTFGFAKAALVAKELERALQEGSNIDASNVSRYLGLADMIAGDISGEAGRSATVTKKPDEAAAAGEAATPAPAAVSARLLLLVSGDESVQAQMQQISDGLGSKLVSTGDWLGAREVWMSQSPDLVVLDLSEDTSGERWTLFRDLGNRLGHVPVLSLLSKKNLADAAAFGSLVGRAVLLKPLKEGQLETSVKKILARGDSAQTRILAVDDDPQVLGALEALLTPLRMHVTTLSDPLEFWDVIDEATPDVLILDIDMPYLSGVEICRSIRSNARWCQIPIIFLSVYNDTATINRLFLAGADDYVSKPFIGPELVTRISNRLARTSNVDQKDNQMSGFSSRTRSVDKIRTYLEQAQADNLHVSLALLHVDKYEAIVKEHGRVAGDKVVEELGRRLSKALRGQDVVTRWGRSELAICLYNIEKSVAENRLEHILGQQLESGFSPIEGITLKVTTSIGVAQFPEDSSNLQRLLRCCDLALAQAKGTGGNRIVLAATAPDDAPEPDDIDLVVVDSNQARAQTVLDAAKARDFSTRYYSEPDTAVRELTGERPTTMARVLLLPDQSVLERLGSLRRITKVVVVAEQEQALIDAFDQGAFDCIASSASLPVLMKRIERAVEA